MFQGSFSVQVPKLQILAIEGELRGRGIEVSHGSRFQAAKTDRFRTDHL